MMVGSTLKPKVFTEGPLPKQCGPLLYQYGRGDQSPRRQWAATVLPWERRGRDGGVDTRCEPETWLHGTSTCWVQGGGLQ